MREIKWQLKETFTFPQTSGKPVAIEKVQVTPQYQVEENDDMTALKGIYHIAANVVFEEDEQYEVHSDAAIQIEDIELPSGYFEYAAPFTIDLPIEAQGPFRLATDYATYHFNDAQQVEIIWDVQCSYKEVVVMVESAEVEEKSEELVEVSTNHPLSFIASLKDNESKTVYHLNNVLMKSES